MTARLQSTPPGSGDVHTVGGIVATAACVSLAVEESSEPHMSDGNECKS